jgi:hypothetical protein
MLPTNLKRPWGDNDHSCRFNYSFRPILRQGRPIPPLLPLTCLGVFELDLDLKLLFHLHALAVKSIATRYVDFDSRTGSRIALPSNPAATRLIHPERSFQHLNHPP